MGNDAIELKATVGGIKLDGNNNTLFQMNTDGSVVSQYQNNKTHTIKNENDSVKLVFDDTTNSSETITMTNSTGVGNESIALTSTLGDVKLTSNTATTDNIVVTNTLGTANDAIELKATVGGIKLDGNNNTLFQMNTDGSVVS